MIRCDHSCGLTSRGSRGSPIAGVVTDACQVEAGKCLRSALLGGQLLRAFESTELETDSERCQAWLGRFAPAGGHLAYVLMI
jgi:hypothetical protein